MAAIDKINNELKLGLSKSEMDYIRDTMARKYAPPQSNKQISTLLHINRPAVYYRLALLICKFRSSWNFAAANFFLLKNKNETDLNYFTKIFLGDASRHVGGSKEYIAGWMANHILKYIKAPKAYLDVGCGNCILTRDLGRALNTPIVWGADIEQEFERKWADARPKDITFKTIKKNRLNFEQKFDVISCFMVLHHVPPEILDVYLADIYNALTPNGLFILKEHDCFNAVDRMIADLEHSLFIARESVAETKKIDSDAITKIREQVIHYKNRFEWRYLIQSKGFQQLFEVPYDLNPTHVYPSNRAYFSIFKKIEL